MNTEATILKTLKVRVKDKDAVDVFTAG